MLSVSNVSVEYGSVRVVRDLSFTLQSDEILMLVGPTGCGKTTLLHAIAGLVAISEGSIGGEGWTSCAKALVPPEQRNVGMVFQDFALFPHLSVIDNVAFRLKDRAPADHWISLLGLETLRDARPARLSGGQKQRVALARALAHEPSLLLLDEPLSNLDAALKDNLRFEIRDALKEAGLPAIWVTHDQSEALSVGDRLGVMNAGQLEQLDTPEHCFTRPANRFVAGFLGEANLIPGDSTGTGIKTELGLITTDHSPALGSVEVLLRPEDLQVHVSDGEVQARVASLSFEGSTVLYRLCLPSGLEIKARTSTDRRFSPGDSVRLSKRPLLNPAVFAANKMPV
ncbi:ABC transporter ATP-binding protein [Halioglobus pacificus]|uniref:ABC transporter n=1 Tax=Parahalioglobus pacificus TaxID=930806 RepID=A0A918XLC2_9GAMM|nr:ABC transporter ATP-binding protein [Halioglobus pacificus]GHD37244.1 ABC transporter [Halioglobus pacificus]